MNTHTREWTRIVAHEMRNSIAAVTAGLDLLRSRGADPEALADISGLMQQSLHQLARLVGDLQDEQQSAQRRFALVQQRFALISVVRQAVGATRPLIEGRGHVLTEQLPSVASIVKGDPDRLAQVFVNLLENAALYTEPGGHIALSVERNATSAIVRIQDNGIGIAPQLLPHVFEIYVRGAAQTAVPFFSFLVASASTPGILRVDYEYWTCAQFSRPGASSLRVSRVVIARTPRSTRAHMLGDAREAAGQAVR